MPRITGLDLAAKDKNASGIAVLDSQKRRFIEIRHAYKDEDIIGVIEGHSSTIVVVDAPLSLPPSGKAFREVELEALKRGARLLPLVSPAMRTLALRAINLANKLRTRGIKVYETHPWSALRLSNCALEELLSRLGIRGLPTGLSRHERDAVIAAIVGLCVFEGCAESIRGGKETIFLLKKIC